MPIYQLPTRPLNTWAMHEKKRINSVVSDTYSDSDKMILS